MFVVQGGFLRFGHCLTDDGRVESTLVPCRFVGFDGFGTNAHCSALLVGHGSSLPIRFFWESLTDAHLNDGNRIDHAALRTRKPIISHRQLTNITPCNRNTSANPSVRSRGSSCPMVRVVSAVALLRSHLPMRMGPARPSPSSMAFSSTTAP